MKNIIANVHSHFPNTSRTPPLSPKPGHAGKLCTMEVLDTVASCGICLSDEGKTSRGEIDSCDHYFCFVCIMEWSKVESRCPLCKRRFTRIRRPPKQGIFPSERVVDVPERTQVYHPMGIVSTGPYDPFAGVKCSVCNTIGEESYLLLCDLCDMAAHTYCIGLGTTVPEGDWLCHDCNTCKAELVDIMDMVQSPQVVRLAKEGPSNSIQQSSPISTNKKISIAHGNVGQGSSSVETSINEASHNPSSRTLVHRRNVLNRIQALRENWNSLQNGTKSFSSIFAETSAKDSRILNNSVHRNRSDLCDFSSHKRHRQLMSQDHSSDASLSGKDSDVIRRSWKMMDMAKRACSSASSAPKSTRTSSLNEKSEKARFSLHRKVAHPLGTRDWGRPETRKRHNTHADEKNRERHNLEKFGKKQQQQHMSINDVSGSSSVLSSNHSQGYCGLPHSRCPEAGLKSDAFCMSNIHKSEGLREASSDIGGKQHHSKLNQTRPRVPEPCNLSSARKSQNYHVTFCEGRSEASFAKSREDVSDAKNEIQTFVKLNLKRLTKEKTLEVNAFKDVARRSTHIILGACGLEQPKYDLRSFPTTKCGHMETNKSTLMPDSCQKCFSVFVKNVVSFILFEKTGSRSC